MTKYVLNLFTFASRAFTRFNNLIEWVWTWMLSRRVIPPCFQLDFRLIFQSEDADGEAIEGISSTANIIRFLFLMENLFCFPFLPELTFLFRIILIKFALSFEVLCWCEKWFASCSCTTLRYPAVKKRILRKKAFPCSCILDLKDWAGRLSESLRIKVWIFG